MVEHTCNPVPGYVYRAVHYRGEQSVPVWLVFPERDTDQSRYGSVFVGKEKRRKE